jgi:hypothetical protein
MEIFIDFLKEINIAQIIIIFGGMWFFYNSLDEKIDEVHQRIDKLCERVDDIDKRLCRIERSLSTHGH